MILYQLKVEIYQLFQKFNFYVNKITRSLSRQILNIQLKVLGHSRYKI